MSLCWKFICLLLCVKNDEREGVEFLEGLLSAVMKVSSLTMEKSVASSALACSDKLYQQLFTWAGTGNNLSLVNNALLVHLGLIKVNSRSANYTRVIWICRAMLPTQTSAMSPSLPSSRSILCELLCGWLLRCCVTEMCDIVYNPKKCKM